MTALQLNDFEECFIDLLERGNDHGAAALITLLMDRAKPADLKDGVEISELSTENMRHYAQYSGKLLGMITGLESDYNRKMRRLNEERLRDPRRGSGFYDRNQFREAVRNVAEFPETLSRVYGCVLEYCLRIPYTPDISFAVLHGLPTLSVKEKEEVMKCTRNVLEGAVFSTDIVIPILRNGFKASTKWTKKEKAFFEKEKEKEASSGFEPGQTVFPPNVAIARMIMHMVIRKGDDAALKKLLGFAG